MIKFFKNLSRVLTLFVLFLIILNFLPRATNFINFKFNLKKENSIYDFRLITHFNENFEKKDLEQKPSIFFFGFTNCPDVCPLTLFKLSQIINQLKVENKVKVFFVTLDPQRDGPYELQKYLKFYDLEIIGLTGKKKDIKKFAKFMNIKFVKRTVDDDYTIDHTASVILLDKKLNIFEKIYYEEDIEGSSEKIKNLIRASL